MFCQPVPSASLPSVDESADPSRASGPPVGGCWRDEQGDCEAIRHLGGHSEVSCRQRLAKARSEQQNRSRCDRSWARLHNGTKKAKEVSTSRENLTAQDIAATHSARD